MILTHYVLKIYQNIIDGRTLIIIKILDHVILSPNLDLKNRFILS
jgi:hypothetical protein